MKTENKNILKGMCAGLFLGNIAVFSTVFPRPVKKWKRDQYDCALVCGFPAEEDGSPSEIMKTRVLKAVELWQEKKVRYLLFSGGGVKNSHIEGKVMKKYAVSLGVLEDVIITEERSVSTYHNMMHAKEIMKEHDLKHCVIVTSRWHLRKANHYAQKFGYDYVMCGAEEPKNSGTVELLWRYLSTNLYMYWNFYKGLY